MRVPFPLDNLTFLYSIVIFTFVLGLSISIPYVFAQGDVDPTPSTPEPIPVPSIDPEPPQQTPSSPIPTPPPPEVPTDILATSDFITPEDEENCHVSRIESHYYNPFSMQILFENNVDALFLVSSSKPTQSQQRTNQDANTINFLTNSTDFWTMKFLLPYDDFEGKTTTIQYFTENRIINTEKIPLTTNTFCKLFFITTEPKPYTPTFEEFQLQVQNELAKIVTDLVIALVDISDELIFLIFAFIGVGVVIVIFLLVNFIQKRDEKDALDQATKSFYDGMNDFNSVASGTSLLLTHELGKFEAYVEQLKLTEKSMMKAFQDFVTTVNQPIKTKVDVPKLQENPIEKEVKEEENDPQLSGGFVVPETPKKTEKSVLDKLPNTFLDMIKRKKIENENQITLEEFYVEYSTGDYSYDDLQREYLQDANNPDLRSTPWLLAKQNALAKVIRERLKEIAEKNLD